MKHHLVSASFFPFVVFYDPAQFNSGNNFVKQKEGELSISYLIKILPTGKSQLCSPLCLFLSSLLPSPPVIIKLIISNKEVTSI